MIASNFVCEFVVCKVMPYLTISIFILGIAYRIGKWNKAKVAKMTLFPAPASQGDKWKRILKEALIFRGLLEGNRPLWTGTGVFHAALALIIVGHSRVFTDFPLIWNALGLDKTHMDTLSYVMGGVAGLVIMATALYLLFRRLSVQRVKISPMLRTILPFF
jgi:nitrate reductase gamma subunit